MSSKIYIDVKKFVVFLLCVYLFACVRLVKNLEIVNVKNKNNDWEKTIF